MISNRSKKLQRALLKKHAMLPDHVQDAEPLCAEEELGSRCRSAWGKAKGQKYRGEAA